MQTVRVSVEAGFCEVGAVCPSERTRAVEMMFGLHAATAGTVRQVELTIAAGDVVLLSGASGTGKSTLLRRIEGVLRRMQNVECRMMNDEANPQSEIRNPKNDAGNFAVVRLTDIPLDSARAVVDCFDMPLEETLGVLSRAGLSEARVWLRSPAQLSEGEQFRYRLAKFMASDAQVLIADEFCAALDRVTARVVAWQLGRCIRQSGRAAVVATSHDDLDRDLRSSVVLRLPDCGSDKMPGHDNVTAMKCPTTATSSEW